MLLSRVCKSVPGALSLHLDTSLSLTNQRGATRPAMAVALLLGKSLLRQLLFERMKLQITYAASLSSIKVSFAKYFLSVSSI